MTRHWIDAEYTVVSGPMRPGDPHPTKKRWRFVYADPATGIVYWYIRPRFNRWQFFLLLCAVSPVLMFLLTYGPAIVAHYWPR